VSIAFRNVDVEPGSSPDEWPFEAVLAALERGALSDWRVLAAAVRDQPWGPCAQAIDAIVSWGELGAVGTLFAETLRRARVDFDRTTAERYGAWIRNVRRSLGMSLREFAPRIGTSASRLSSYEQGAVAPGVAILGRVERISGQRVGESPAASEARSTRPNAS
jgi:hypothetical protein